MLFSVSLEPRAACFCKLIINRPGTQVSVLGVELNEITGNLKAYCFLSDAIVQYSNACIERRQ